MAVSLADLTNIYGPSCGDLLQGLLSSLLSAPASLQSLGPSSPHLHEQVASIPLTPATAPLTAALPSQAFPSILLEGPACIGKSHFLHQCARFLTEAVAAAQPAQPLYTYHVTPATFTAHYGGDKAAGLQTVLARAILVASGYGSATDKSFPSGPVLLLFDDLDQLLSNAGASDGGSEDSDDEEGQGLDGDGEGGSSGFGRSTYFSSLEAPASAFASFNSRDTEHMDCCRSFSSFLQLKDLLGMLTAGDSFSRCKKGSSRGGSAAGAAAGGSGSAGRERIPLVILAAAETRGKRARSSLPATVRAAFSHACRLTMPSVHQKTAVMFRSCLASVLLGVSSEAGAAGREAEQQLQQQLQTFCERETAALTLGEAAFLAKAAAASATEALRRDYSLSSDLSALMNHLLQLLKEGAQAHSPFTVQAKAVGSYFTGSSTSSGSDAGGLQPLWGSVSRAALSSSSSEPADKPAQAPSSSSAPAVSLPPQRKPAALQAAALLPGVVEAEDFSSRSNLQLFAGQLSAVLAHVQAAQAAQGAAAIVEEVVSDEGAAISSDALPDLSALSISVSSGIASAPSSSSSSSVSSASFYSRGFLAEVSGQQEAKQALYEALQWPLDHPELLSSFGIRPASGVLLYGPPGTGKTLLAKALAGHIGARFFNLSIPSILSSAVGESEKLLATQFQLAQVSAPSVVFIDEIQALFLDRQAGHAGGGGGDETGRFSAALTSQLLLCMDGLARRRRLSTAAGGGGGGAAVSPVLVLAATNLPDALDSALLRPGRFDACVYVGLPQKQERAEQLLSLLRKTKLDQSGGSRAGGSAGPGVAESDKQQEQDDSSLLQLCEELAVRTEGYSGADMANLVRKAGMLAAGRIVAALEGGRHDSSGSAALASSSSPSEGGAGVTEDDLRTAASLVKPSVSKQTVRKLQVWRAK